MNNNFYMIGRLTKDPVLNIAQSSGKYNTRITLAVQNGKDDVSFIEMMAFNELSNTICKYCKKGDLIATRGIVKNNNWEDSKGNKHYDYNFIIGQVSFLNTSKKEDPYEDFADKVEVTDDFLD